MQSMTKHSGQFRSSSSLYQFWVKALIVCFACVSLASAQKSVPQQPWLQSKAADGKAIGISLSVYNASVEIQGLLAETTITMTFRNHETRVLEGELHFPLPEGSTVSGYGLDIDGVLVEGVIVQKDKARRVFNTEVRKKVDPGIVSWTRGNQFKTRVYPIPAGGTRTVMVRYVSQVDGHGKEEAVFVLPKVPNRVDIFSLRIEVPQEYTLDRPQLRGGLLEVAQKDAAWRWLHTGRRLRGAVSDADFTLGFTLAGGRWVMTHRALGVQFSQDVQIVLPRLPAKIVSSNRHSDNHTYFLINDAIDHYAPPISMPPRRVALFWDASLSRHGATGTEKELAFLAALLNEWGPAVQVELTLLRDTADYQRSYPLVDDGLESLLADLRGVVHDGGTDLRSVTAERIGNADAVLLFSDGQHNMGAGLPDTSAAPIFAITARPGANFILLRHIAAMSGGQFINLGHQSAEVAAATIAGSAGLHFMGAVALSGTIDSVFPKGQPLVQGRLAVTGRMSSPEATIELRYGRGGSVMHRTRVTLFEGDATEDHLVTWYHAAQQVAELALFPDRNADALLALGRAHGLVTPQTSLLVLDTLEQHLQHDVEPARSRVQMHAAWVKRKKDKTQREGTASAQHLKTLLQLWKGKKEWHAKDFVKSTKKHASADVHAGSGGSAAEEAGAAAEETYTTTTAETYTTTTAETYTTTTSTSTTTSTTTTTAGIYTTTTTPTNAEAYTTTTTPTNAGIYTTTTTSGNVDHNHNHNHNRNHNHNHNQRGGAAAKSGSKTRQILTGAIQIKAWDPDTPYMTQLKSAGGYHCATACDACDRRTCVPAAYEVYRTLRDHYASSPAFFLDVATWFYSEPGGTAFGRRVLSSILELDLDDPSLLRVVAYRLTQARDFDLAISILEDVLRMRPEEPQSHRDLALALARRSEGQRHRGVADLERAMALLHKVVMTEWRQGIHLIALTELNRLWARADALDADAATTKVSRPALHPGLVANLAVDLRVALSWDADATDVDLWVLEPSGEKAYYGHKRTRLGGLVSRDITDGYGPETYNLKRVVAGKYVIQANYYGSNQQKLLGSVTIKAAVFSNYGRENEVRKELTIRLDKIKQVVTLGELDLRNDAAFEA